MTVKIPVAIPEKMRDQHWRRQQSGFVIAY